MKACETCEFRELCIRTPDQCMCMYLADENTPLRDEDGDLRSALRTCIDCLGRIRIFHILPKWRRRSEEIYEDILDLYKQVVNNDE